MPIPQSMICECLRCGRVWMKRIPTRPARCPKCKQPNWDTPSPGLGRPPKTAEKAKKAPRHIDSAALGLWERLKDFERWEFAARSIKDLLAEMTEPMREDSVRIISALSVWFNAARQASTRKRKAGG